MKKWYVSFVLILMLSGCNQKMVGLPQTSGKSSITEKNPELSKYEEGDYQVGVNLPKGKYQVVSNGGAANYQVFSEGETEPAQKSKFESYSYVSVDNGELLKAENCHLLPLSQKKNTTVEPSDIEPGGTYHVGIDIPEGGYSISPAGESMGFCIVYDDFPSSQSDSQAHGILDTTFIDLKEGQFLALDDSYANILSSEETQKIREIKSIAEIPKYTSEKSGDGEKVDVYLDGVLINETYQYEMLTTTQKSFYALSYFLVSLDDISDLNRFMRNQYIVVGNSIAYPLGELVDAVLEESNFYGKDSHVGDIHKTMHEVGFMIVAGLPGYFTHYGFEKPVDYYMNHF